MHEAVVQFYTYADLVPHAETKRACLHLRVTQALAGSRFIHCNVLSWRRDEPIILNCASDTGCVGWLSKEYPAKPSFRIAVAGDLMVTPWAMKWKFSRFRTILDLLHLCPRRWRPINCVTVTALAIGLTQRCRTPDDIIGCLEQSHE